MKLAIPTADGKLCPHFGHCEHFALIEIDPDTHSIGETAYLTPPPHAPGVLPAWLAQQSADVIIAGGMGQRAVALFASHDIRVVVGAPCETPEALAQAWLEGTLQPGENVCDH